MTDRYQALRDALAAGPTPGPYQGQANAALIAAANPETIAALLAERDALRDACAAMIAWDDRERDHSVDFGERMELCRAAFEKARAALSIGGSDV